MILLNCKEFSDIVHATCLNVFSHLFRDDCFQWQDTHLNCSFSLKNGKTSGVTIVRNWEGRVSSYMEDQVLISNPCLFAYREESKEHLSFDLLWLHGKNEWAGCLTIAHATNPNIVKYSDNYDRNQAIRDVTIELIKNRPNFNYDYLRNRTHIEMLADRSANTVSQMQKLNEQFIRELIGSIPLYKNESMIIAAFATELAQKTEVLYDANNSYTIIPEYRKWKANHT